MANPYNEGEPNDYDYNYNAEWPDYVSYPDDYVSYPSIPVDELTPGKRYYAYKDTGTYSVPVKDIHKIIFNSYEGPIYEPGYLPRINRNKHIARYNATFIVNYTDVDTMDPKQGVVKYNPWGDTTIDSLIFHQINPVEEEKIRQNTIEKLFISRRVPENVANYEIREYLGKNGGRRLTKRSKRVTKRSKRTKRSKQSKRSKSHRRR